MSVSGLMSTKILQYSCHGSSPPPKIDQYGNDIVRKSVKIFLQELSTACHVVSVVGGGRRPFYAIVESVLYKATGRGPAGAPDVTCGGK